MWSANRKVGTSPQKTSEQPVTPLLLKTIALSTRCAVRSPRIETLALGCDLATFYAIENNPHGEVSESFDLMLGSCGDK